MAENSSIPLIFYYTENEVTVDSLFKNMPSLCEMSEITPCHSQSYSFGSSIPPLEEITPEESIFSPNVEIESSVKDKSLSDPEKGWLVVNNDQLDSSDIFFDYSISKAISNSESETHAAQARDKMLFNSEKKIDCNISEISTDLTVFGLSQQIEHQAHTNIK
ncbi:hypothetical protein MXB_5531, partial [Myxobolus squamalis]